MCINYTAAGVQVVLKPTVLDDWSESASYAALAKSHTMGPLRFHRFLENLGVGFEVLKIMLMELRGKLFLHGETFVKTPPGDCKHLYDEIINAIDRQLIDLRARGGTKNN